VIPDFKRDQAEVAWEDVLIQFQNKPNMQAFIKSLFPPLTSLVSEFERLLIERDIDTARGKSLDGIGEIVGISRTVPQGIVLSYFGFRNQAAGVGFGRARMRHRDDPISASMVMADTEYRDLIRAKIALNNGHGTPNEIIRAVTRLMRAPVVYLVNIGNATARIWIGRIPSPAEPPFSFFEPLIPVAAGVRLIPTFFDLTHSFGFRNQGLAGFGVGIMARSQASNTFGIGV